MGRNRGHGRRSCDVAAKGRVVNGVNGHLKEWGRVGVGDGEDGDAGDHLLRLVPAHLRRPARRVRVTAGSRSRVGRSYTD